MNQPLQAPSDRPRYLYVQTFGCQMNEYDSRRVEGILAAEGYRPTDDISLADVIFLNTCSVRDKAEQKVHSFLGRLRRLKRRNPDLKIIVAGCVAQQIGKGLLSRFEHLDIVLGTRGISSVAQVLDRVSRTGERLSFLPLEEPSAEPGATQDLPCNTGQVAASVTVMQGCNNFCTYCIVPYVRGRERSRPSGEIVKEINGLVTCGVREVLLLGQNVNSYGRGLEESVSFIDLLKRIHEETDIQRIRFTTSHPKDLTDGLIESFATLPRLCSCLHLPFQSGSDRILERMNRVYTSAEYIGKIEKLRHCCPEIGLTSDVMVGFPGETEEDFQETLRLMDRVQFDNLFSFRYSDRPYARSVEFPDKVSEEVKARRLAELQAMQAEITLRKNRDEIGKIREILVEGPSKTSNGQLTGRTQQNRIVNFESTGDLAGSFARVRVIDAFSHSLRGELVADLP